MTDLFSFVLVMVSLVLAIGVTHLGLTSQVPCFPASLLNVWLPD